MGIASPEREQYIEFISLLHNGQLRRGFEPNQRTHTHTHPRKREKQR